MEVRVNERTRLLEEGSRLVQEVLDTTPNLLCLFNVEIDTFNYVNREFSEFFGVTNEEMLRLGPSFMRGRVYPVDQGIFNDHSRKLSVIPDNEVVQSEFRLINFDGIPKWICFRSLVFHRNEKNEPKLVLFVGQDITEFKETEARLRYLSIHDQLTGLYNRLYFEEEIVRLEKGRSFPVSTIMADLDELKEINDTHGHSAGDQLLVQTAAIFRSCFRAEDVVARIGGDEFAALLPGSNAPTAYKVIERINNKLAESSCTFLGKQISISIGMATTEKGGSLIESIKAADQSMYAAKQVKRDVVTANETLNEAQIYGEIMSSDDRDKWIDGVHVAFTYCNAEGIIRGYESDSSSHFCRVRWSKAHRAKCSGLPPGKFPVETAIFIGRTAFECLHDREKWP